MGCEVSWLENAYTLAHCFRRAILTRKVGQTGLVFGVRSRFISRSVHASLQSSVSVVTICSTLVNIQTYIHTHTHTYTHTDIDRHTAF